MSGVSAEETRERTDKWSGCFPLGDTTIGIELEASDEGLTKCHIQSAANAEQGAATAEVQSMKPSNPHLQAAINQLTEYFAGERTTFEVTLAEAGTPFQKQVWAANRQIPCGQTRSYWWVAVRLGNPQAVRAVGAALGDNPLPIFTPCHRVLKQDGSIGGFSCGIEWKQLLLEHETIHAFTT